MTTETSEASESTAATSVRKAGRTDEDVGGVIRGACANIFANPEQASLKRVAWAYGCAKKDSDEEGELLKLLIERMRAIVI